MAHILDRVPHTFMYRPADLQQPVWSDEYQQLDPYLDAPAFGSFVGRIGAKKWKEESVARGKIAALQLKTQILALLALVIVVSAAQCTLLHFIKNGKLNSSAYVITSLVGGGMALIALTAVIAKFYRIFSSTIATLETPAYTPIFNSKVLRAYKQAPSETLHPLLGTEPTQLAHSATATIMQSIYPVVLQATLAQYNEWRSTARVFLLIAALAFITGLAVGLTTRFKYNVSQTFSFKTAFISTVVTLAVSSLLLLLLVGKAIPWISKKQIELEGSIQAEIPAPPSQHHIYPLT